MILVAVAATTAAHGDALSLQATEDTFVDQANPDVRYGYWGVLKASGAAPEMRSFIRFDTTGIPGQVSQATLRLFSTRAVTTGFDVRAVAGGWSEGTTTYSSAPRLGSVLASSGPIPRDGWVSLDITPYVVGNAVNLAIVAPSAMVTFPSRERANAPVLDVTTVPRPPSPSAPLATSVDTFVDQTAPDTWYGAWGILKVGGSPEQIALLRFDLGGITGPIISATLRVYATRKHVGISAHEVESSWSGKSTYNTGPSLGPAVSTSGSTNVYGTWVRIDVTPIVRAGGMLDVGLTSDGPALQILRSAESSDPPQLIVQTGLEPVIGAAGDIACSPNDANYNGGLGTSFICRQMATSDALLAAGLDAVITMGDNQYENGEPAFFEQAYGSSWGRLRAITRPGVGNHDYHTAGAAGYFGYFGDAAGDTKRGYYSYDLGTWHLIALNSNCAVVGGCQAGSAQERWLREDLALHPATCTLAYWHHARFSSGKHDNNATYLDLWRALSEGGADLVLNGHDHLYERFAPQSPDGVADGAGIRQIIVGTGGRSGDQLSTLKPNSELLVLKAFGILKVVLRPSSYVWQFVPASGEQFADSDIGACH